MYIQQPLSLTNAAEATFFFHVLCKVGTVRYANPLQLIPHLLLHLQTRHQQLDNLILLLEKLSEFASVVGELEHALAIMPGADLGTEIRPV